MTLKGLLQFITLALYILGAIGGFGYACYSGAYLIAVAVLVLAVMAFPTAKRIFQEWTK